MTDTKLLNDNLLPLNTPNTSYAIEHHISDEQRADLAEIAPNLSDEDMLAKGLSAAEIRVVHEFIKNPYSSFKEIAENLHLSEDTIKTQWSKACDKLGIPAGRGRRRRFLAKYPPSKP